MDQNFTFLSGLSSKRAKSEAKASAKANNTSLVHELNSIALMQCGMTWAEASKTFNNIASPLINNRDVEELLQKHQSFTINGELRPSDQKVDKVEVIEWQKHLLTLNLICHYLQNNQFNKLPIDNPSNITPIIIAVYFNDLHFAELPAYKLSQLESYKHISAWKDYISEFYSELGFDSYGLFLLAFIHMGYQYKYVLDPNNHIGFFKVNIGLEDVREKHINEYNSLGSNEKFKNAESFAQNMDLLFKHKSVSNPYYPNSIEAFKHTVDVKKNTEIFAKVTPKGLGVQIYGTEAQLRGIYEALHLVLDPNYDEDAEESDEVMFMFELCYDIRKAFQGSRDELRIKINNEPVFGVKVLLPTLVTQMHCLYKYLCNTRQSRDLKEHVQSLIDTVLEAICDRSSEGYQGVVDWMVKTPILHDQFDFELLSIACNDHLTRYKGIKTRLKNLPIILSELVKNDGSNKSFVRKIQQSENSINDYFEQCDEW